MDTENELAENAYCDTLDQTRAAQYACAVSPCDAPMVDDLADLNRCEKCGKRVCDTHNRKRRCYGLCVTCDRSERAELAVLLPDDLVELAGKIQAHIVTAEEVGMALYGLLERASDIEGA